jgi:hypothetical protein
MVARESSSHHRVVSVRPSEQSTTRPRPVLSLIHGVRCEGIAVRWQDRLTLGANNRNTDKSL